MPREEEGGQMVSDFSYSFLNRRGPRPVQAQGHESGSGFEVGQAKGSSV